MIEKKLLHRGEAEICTSCDKNMKSMIKISWKMKNRFSQLKLHKKAKISGTKLPASLETLQKALRLLNRSQVFDTSPFCILGQHAMHGI